MNDESAATRHMTSGGLPADLTRRLWRLKVVARVALGFVWVWEGLVPKLLCPSTVQWEMVRRSGLFWPTPELWLGALGVAQIVAGMILVIGWVERPAIAVATVSLLILIALVVINEPHALTDPYGGVAKDACLLACAAVVWSLSPLTR